MDGPAIQPQILASLVPDRRIRSIPDDPRADPGQQQVGRRLLLTQVHATGRRDRSQQRTLLARDVAATAEPSDVCAADVGDQRVVRPCQRGVALHLADGIDADLEHGEPLLSGHSQHRHRQADLGVERRLRHQAATGPVQYRSQDLLGRGLAAAARDRNAHRGAMDRAVAARQVIQRGQRVVDRDQRAVLCRLDVPVLADQRRRGSTPERVVHELVTVGMLPRQSHEQGPSSSEPRVRDDLGHTGFGAASDPGTQHAGDLVHGIVHDDSVPAC